VVPFPETVPNFVCHFKGSLQPSNWTLRSGRSDPWVAAFIFGLEDRKKVERQFDSGARFAPFAHFRLAIAGGVNDRSSLVGRPVTEENRAALGTSCWVSHWLHVEAFI
jgi:hypothetical protein